MTKTAFFTMDVESFSDISCLKDNPRPEYDAFRIEQSIGDYLDLLGRYNIKATFFVLCSSLKHAKEYLLRAVREGHEIALHGLTHEIPAEMNREELYYTISEGKALLEKELGTKVIGYRAPCFAISDETLEVIRELGFKYDSSYLDIKMRYYRSAASFDGFENVCGGILTRDGFYEIPPCKAKTVMGEMSLSGGGYVRIAPFFFVGGHIKRFLNKSSYYMFYCHPSDMFTDKPPKLPGVSSFNKFFIKTGRKRFLSRTESIIKTLIKKGFSFSTLRDFAERSRLQ
ncbi:MAG: polysaccharide deacetylase family protein [Clostridiales bacterium]|nr:polysaccharide deacetylase family protein [Clostridiales bacterium]